MTWRQVVLWGMAAAGVVLAVVEAGAICTKTKGDTISEIVRQTSRDWPLIPFLLGALMAHFFWRN